MAAAVGFVLEESFNSPKIAKLAVSKRENVVHIQRVGAGGFNGMESLEDLRSSWNRLILVAGLMPEQRQASVEYFMSRVADVLGTGWLDSTAADRPMSAARHRNLRVGSAILYTAIVPVKVRT